MSKDKALIVLGQKHFKLVETLKRALLLGNIAFLKAGKILNEIKEKKTYKLEDSSRDCTWREFLSRPDLPFPGRTPASRRRTADALIRIYKIFIKKFAFPNNDLAQVGWTKLNLIAPICESKDKVNLAQDWVDKARELSVGDLMVEIRDKEKIIGEGIACAHLGAYQIWSCPSCGARSKKKLSK